MLIGVGARYHRCAFGGVSFGGLVLSLHLDCLGAEVMFFSIHFQARLFWKAIFGLFQCWNLV